MSDSERSRAALVLAILAIIFIFVFAEIDANFESKRERLLRERIEQLEGQR